MLVTEDVFHPERLPLTLRAPLNMLSMLVTPDRSGASVALYTMLVALKNMSFTADHCVVPHCFSSTSSGMPLAVGSRNWIGPDALTCTV